MHSYECLLVRFFFCSYIIIFHVYMQQSVFRVKGCAAKHALLFKEDTVDSAYMHGLGTAS